MIRPATAGEHDDLVELQRRASLVWEDTRADLLAHPDAVSIDPASVVRVFEHDGRVLGFSATLPGAPDTWELDGLFVEPDGWRGGVGRALIADVSDRAAADGIARIEVTANPNALGFYDAVGFRDIGVVATRFGPGRRMALAVPGA